MIQEPHAVDDVLDFYERVNLVLSEWLAKVKWTERETAMLCAGFVPNCSDEVQSINDPDSQDFHEEDKPLDPGGFLPADIDVLNSFLYRLDGKEAASPRNMVDLLIQSVPFTLRTGRLQKEPGVVDESLRLFTLDSFRELQWLLIIGNAVGISVPTTVPFALLNRMRDRLADKPAGVSGDAEATPGLRVRVRSKRQPVPSTPQERGYYTTEEVAGLTNLLPETLNKYAREEIPVEGFAPFKRLKGRSWQWRDGRQQALQASSTADHSTLGSQQSRSLATLLSPKPFRK